MRGGRNKFGPMYKRDRARKLQIIRQRQLALQALRGQMSGQDNALSQLSQSSYQASPYSSMQIKQEIQIPQVSVSWYFLCENQFFIDYDDDFFFFKRCHPLLRHLTHHRVRLPLHLDKLINQTIPQPLSHCAAAVNRIILVPQPTQLPQYQRSYLTARSGWQIQQRHLHIHLVQKRLISTQVQIHRVPQIPVVIQLKH